MQTSLPQECARFMSMLDDRLDGVLSKEETAFMDEHARKCGACAERMRLSLEIKSFMSGLDDGISVPLEAQAAWRKAVRAEKRRKNRRWVRGLSGIAAAIVVLFGSTIWLRSAGTLNTAAVSADEASAELHSQRRISIPSEYAPSMKSAGRINAPMLVESDGDEAWSNEDAQVVLDEAPVISQTEQAVEDPDIMLVKSAYRSAQTESFEKDRGALGLLVDEYGGFMALDEVSFLENEADRKAVTEIRIPVALLDEFMVALENVGTTVSVQVKNEDVSAYYFDAESRLNAQQAIVNRLNELILTCDADKIQVLKTQLMEAYDEIDNLNSVIQAYRNEVTYANVRMELYEGKAVSAARILQPTPTREPTLSERSASGFRQSLNKVRAFFEDMVVSMAIIAPVVFVALGVAAIAGGAVWLVKKRKKVDKNEETNE